MLSVAWNPRWFAQVRLYWTVQCAAVQSDFASSLCAHSEAKAERFREGAHSKKRWRFVYATWCIRPVDGAANGV